MSEIRTPDQRLRVFVSSTIEELREERRVVRESIERLRLIPVLFESGARPYAPRELYRAYLDQSDIFIGIYASSYGWVAPDMDISGLEDEYHLSAGRPQLIYIKQNGAAREPKLEALLRTIKAADGVSYQKFSTPEQLAELLQNDLALLSERFVSKAKGPSPQGHGLPAMRNATIGRERERAELAELLLRKDIGLVTLTGTGGTGKSHLALRVAHDVEGRFPDGACFVSLASVSRSEQVLPAIAAALGVADTGQRDLLDALAEQLGDKEPLVLIDNFEHVLEAAPVVSTLLSRLPKLTLLVTSRAPLHLVGEQVYAVQPLAEPTHGEQRKEELLACASVDLFVQRARARAAQLVLDDTNVRAIAELCRHLEGLPLAIELAAAHTKYFTPAALAARTGHMLDLLARGPRDLPERQRTMRAAIASSVDLLSAPHRAFFRRLSVFSERWTLDAAEAITDANALGSDTMEAVEQLIDMGLVRVAPARSTDPDAEPRFVLLQVVREFAAEELVARGEREAAMQRLLQWCNVLVHKASEMARTDDVGIGLDLVELNYMDLRTLIREAIERNDVITAWTLIAHMNTFWLLRGYRSEALEWLRSTGLDRLATDPAFAASVPALLRGGVLLTAGCMSYYAEQMRVGMDYLERAIALFNEGEAPYQFKYYAWLFLGLARTGNGQPTAGEALDTCIGLARMANDRPLEGLGLCFRTEVLVRNGQPEKASADLATAAAILSHVKNRMLRSSLGVSAGNLSLVQGHYADAMVHYGQCIEVNRALRNAGTLGWAQNGMGYCLVRMGRVEEGRNVLLEGLGTARQSGYQAVLMAQWAGLAWVAALQGDHVRAARLLGAAEAVRSHIQYTPWMATKVVMDSAREATATGLTPEALATEMAIGGTLPAEQVNALAVMAGRIV
jgi:predicted ATPase